MTPEADKTKPKEIKHKTIYDELKEGMERENKKWKKQSYRLVK